MLGYYYISQKFLSVDFGFGLCENSHNAKAKKSKRYENIVKKLVNIGPNTKKMSVYIM